MPGTRLGADMGFFDHLETLRRGIIASLAVFAVAACASFFFMDALMPLILAPVKAIGVKLYTHAPYEKFTAYLKASAILGACVAIPVAAGLAAAFLAPAFEPRVRKSIAAILVAVLAFAFAGAALAWFAFIPWVVGFFSGFAAGDGIEPLWSLNSFISLAAGLIAAMGIVCLVPPGLLVLMRFGVVKPATLAKGRRYAIIAIAIAAGVITPTVDVVTQLIVAAAMWGLFEITLLFGRMLAPREKKLIEKTEDIDG
jgi:sec-independent protein translocase protein TatC